MRFTLAAALVAALLTACASAHPAHAGDSIMLTLDGEQHIEQRSAFSTAVVTIPSGATFTGRLTSNGAVHLIAEDDALFNGTVAAPTVMLTAERLVLGSACAIQATQTNGLGGNILMQAREVSVSSNAVVTADGPRGDGSINIEAEKTVTVARGAHLSASALDRGSGGRVRFFSQFTRFFGRVSVDAGPNGVGDGGFIEVSGEGVRADGTYSRQGSQGGKAGTLSFDPIHITIRNGGNTGCTYGGSSDACIGDLDLSGLASPPTHVVYNLDDTVAPSPTDNEKLNLVISRQALDVELTAGNVILEARREIKFENDANNVAGWTFAGTNDLVLKAGQLITVDQILTFGGKVFMIVNPEDLVDSDLMVRGTGAGSIDINADITATDIYLHQMDCPDTTHFRTSTGCTVGTLDVAVGTTLTATNEISTVIDVGTVAIPTIADSRVNPFIGNINIYGTLEAPSVTVATWSTLTLGTGASIGMTTTALTLSAGQWVGADFDVGSDPNTYDRPTQNLVISSASFNWGDGTSTATLTADGDIQLTKDYVQGTNSAGTLTATSLTGDVIIQESLTVIDSILLKSHDPGAGTAGNVVVDAATNGAAVIVKLDRAAGKGTITLEADLQVQFLGSTFGITLGESGAAAEADITLVSHAALDAVGIKATGTGALTVFADLFVVNGGGTTTTNDAKTTSEGDWVITSATSTTFQDTNVEFTGGASLDASLATVVELTDTEASTTHIQVGGAGGDVLLPEFLCGAGETCQLTSALGEVRIVGEASAQGGATDIVFNAPVVALQAATFLATPTNGVAAFEDITINGGATRCTLPSTPIGVETTLTISLTAAGDYCSAPNTGAGITFGAVASAATLLTVNLENDIVLFDNDGVTGVDATGATAAAANFAQTLSFDKSGGSLTLNLKGAIRRDATFAALATLLVDATQVNMEKNIGDVTNGINVDITSTNVDVKTQAVVVYATGTTATPTLTFTVATLLELTTSLTLHLVVGELVMDAPINKHASATTTPVLTVTSSETGVVQTHAFVQAITAISLIIGQDASDAGNDDVFTFAAAGTFTRFELTYGRVRAVSAVTLTAPRFEFCSGSTAVIQGGISTDANLNIVVTGATGVLNWYCSEMDATVTGAGSTVTIDGSTTTTTLNLQAGQNPTNTFGDSDLTTDILNWVVQGFGVVNVNAPYTIGVSGTGGFTSSPIIVGDDVTFDFDAAATTLTFTSSPINGKTGTASDTLTFELNGGTNAVVHSGTGNWGVLEALESITINAVTAGGDVTFDAPFTARANSFASTVPNNAVDFVLTSGGDVTFRSLTGDIDLSSVSFEVGTSITTLDLLPSAAGNVKTRDINPTTPGSVPLNVGETGVTYTGTYTLIAKAGTTIGMGRTEVFLPFEITDDAATAVHVLTDGDQVYHDTVSVNAGTATNNDRIFETDQSNSRTIHFKGAVVVNGDTTAQVLKFITDTLDFDSTVQTATNLQTVTIDAGAINFDDNSFSTTANTAIWLQYTPAASDTIVVTFLKDLGHVSTPFALSASALADTDVIQWVGGAAAHLSLDVLDLSSTVDAVASATDSDIVIDFGTSIELNNMAIGGTDPPRSIIIRSGAASTCKLDAPITALSSIEIDVNIDCETDVAGVPAAAVLTTTTDASGGITIKSRLHPDVASTNTATLVLTSAGDVTLEVSGAIGTATSNEYGTVTITAADQFTLNSAGFSVHCADDATATARTCLHITAACVEVAEGDLISEDDLLIDVSGNCITAVTSQAPNNVATGFYLKGGATGNKILAGNALYIELTDDEAWFVTNDGASSPEFGANTGIHFTLAGDNYNLDQDTVVNSAGYTGAYDNFLITLRPLAIPRKMNPAPGALSTANSITMEFGVNLELRTLRTTRTITWDDAADTWGNAGYSVPATANARGTILTGNMVSFPVAGTGPASGGCKSLTWYSDVVLGFDWNDLFKLPGMTPGSGAPTFPREDGHLNNAYTWCNPDITTFVSESRPVVTAISADYDDVRKRIVAGIAMDLLGYHDDPVTGSDPLLSEDQITAETSPGSTIVTFTLARLAPGTADGALAALMSVLLESEFTARLQARNYGRVLTGTTFVGGTTEITTLDVSNDNNGYVGQASVFTFAGTLAAMSTIDKNHKWRLAFPLDFWWTPGTPVTVLADVPAPNTPVTGVVDDTGRVVEFSNDNGGVARYTGGDAFEFKVTVTMPQNCLNFNSYVFGTFLTEEDNQPVQYKLVTGGSDTKCHGKSVVIFGDPHFNSFSGGYYDISGRSGGIYTIISDEHFLWNSMFVAKPHADHAAMHTYLGQTGFLVYGHKVTYDPATDNCTLDGQLIPNTDARVFLGNTTFYLKKEANLLILRAPGFRIALKRVLHTHHQRLPHFDHAVDIIRTEVTHPHGLLGQTAAFTEAVKAVDHQGTGVIEGRLEDYEVNNVFSTHSLFNRYGVSKKSIQEKATEESAWFIDWFKHEVIPHGTLKRDGNAVKPAQRTSTFFVTPFTDLKTRPLPSGKTLLYAKHPAFTYFAKLATISGYAGKTMAVEEVELDLKGGAKVIYSAQNNNLTVNGRPLDAGESVELTLPGESKAVKVEKMRVKNGGALFELPGLNVFLRVDMIKGLRFGQQLEVTDKAELAKVEGFLGAVLRSNVRTIEDATFAPHIV